MIAVVLAAPDSATRFQEAQTMLEYGFACCNLYVDENMDPLRPVAVARGACDTVSAGYASEFRCISIDGTPLNGIEKKIVDQDGLTAPIEQG